MDRREGGPGGGVIRTTLLGELLLVGVATLVGGALQAQTGEEAGPLDVGLEERLEVQLVLVDFLVLDRDERTVPDLTLEDFVLVIGGREIPIHSLDLDCPLGAADEPLPAPHFERPCAEPPGRPRRIVLVFDYFHLTNVAETFDRAQQMLDNRTSGAEQHMVVSLGDALRIESPFTEDADDLRWTFDRMRNDPDLYAGNHARLTERRFFERIEMLFDLLERWDGRKSVVLFSGPVAPDGFFHDPEFKRLSALSAATRTAIYPVDTGGLRTPTDPQTQPFGGPPMLRRLANETGGRMTAGTNDIGLAYARAHRDLGCTYTLGFYDTGPRRDRRRRMTIRIKDRRDARVVYPEFYVVRSPEEKRTSLFRTAAMAPQMFESERMTADLVVLGPHSAGRWRALLAVEFRPGPETSIDDDATWSLRGLVRRPNGTIVRSFRKRIRMPRTSPATGRTPAVTWFHELRLPPGRYVVSAVLSDPDADTPHAATRPAVLAEVPHGEPFLVGPLLGRRAEPATTGSDVGAREMPAFEPLLGREARQGQPLESLTTVCVVGGDGPVGLRELVRRVHTWDGDPVQGFEMLELQLDGLERVRCQQAIDRVDTEQLGPGRYELSATAHSADRVTGRGAVEFTILPASAE